ncbi:hypothetical protein Vadar_016660 [Vaccinium darrowii]|uniref:Uncharacterized protein n=1 Tax=Vaccinium darrowii TaxID=229202 RepID=A0ACB7X167_9ERIC|nr:hypothetical protein Vadar_016660 [Vaccinium darrowii]
MTKLIETIFSYHGDVFLVGIVFLLLVILFVLLLHIYAKWFLAHACHQRITRSATVSHILAPSLEKYKIRLRRFCCCRLRCCPKWRQWVDRLREWFEDGIDAGMLLVLLKHEVYFGDAAASFDVVALYEKDLHHRADPQNMWILAMGLFYKGLEQLNGLVRPVDYTGLVKDDGWCFGVFLGGGLGLRAGMEGQWVSYPTGSLVGRRVGFGVADLILGRRKTGYAADGGRLFVQMMAAGYDGKSTKENPTLPPPPHRTIGRHNRLPQQPPTPSCTSGRHHQPTGPQMPRSNKPLGMPITNIHSAAPPSTPTAAIINSIHPPTTVPHLQAQRVPATTRALAVKHEIREAQQLNTGGSVKKDRLTTPPILNHHHEHKAQTT